MEKTINYQDLSTLSNISETLEKLDYFLYHIKYKLESAFNNYHIKKEFNPKESEYILKLNVDCLELKIGFMWSLYDIYYGVIITAPRENGEIITNLENHLIEKKWGFSKRENHIDISYHNRLVDDLFSNQEAEYETEQIMSKFLSNIEEAKLFVDKITCVNV